MIRIATCSYCGARSTIGTEGGQRLVCHGCGAPLRKIETIATKPTPRPGASDGPKPAAPRPAERAGEHEWKDRPARRRKGKRRRGSLLQRLARKLDDLDLDDIFD